MKILSYTCPSAGDRPDYARLVKLTYGSQKARIAIAYRLLLDRHEDCRAFDNCFEMGDGDEIAIALARRIPQDPFLRAAVARVWHPQCLTAQGIPTRWQTLLDRQRASEPQQIELFPQEAAA